MLILVNILRVKRYLNLVLSLYRFLSLSISPSSRLYLILVALLQSYKIKNYSIILIVRRVNIIYDYTNILSKTVFLKIYKIRT